MITTVTQGHIAFVAFVRLVDTPGTADEIYEIYSSLVEAAKKRSGTVVTSPFGVVAVFPGPREALENITGLLSDLEQLSVRVAVGLDYGHVYPVDRDAGQNIASPTINYAARLAFHKDAKLTVLASDRFYKYVDRHTTELRGRFVEKILVGTIKDTLLEYHRIKGPSLKQNLNAMRRVVKTKGDRQPHDAAIVVCDIRGYSTLTPEEALDKLQLLRECEQYCQTRAASPNASSPAGDGDVYEFREFEAESASMRALRFALALRSTSSDVGLDIRVSLAAGPILTYEGGLPVGMPVFEADAAAGQCQAGEIVAREEFARLLPPGRWDNWRFRQLPKSADQMPNAATLCVVDAAPITRSVIDTFRHTRPSADDFFFTGDDEPVSFNGLVSGSTEVSILSRTAINLLSQHAHVLSGLAKGGCQVRLLLLDPSSEAASYVYGGSGNLYRQNLSIANHHIARIRREAGKCFEVRATKHPKSTT